MAILKLETKVMKLYDNEMGFRKHSMSVLKQDRLRPLLNLHLFVL